MSWSSTKLDEGSKEEMNILRIVNDPLDNSDNDKNEENVYNFKKIENCGGGNCLFYVLDKFLHRNDTDFIPNEQQVRQSIVDFITQPDRATRTKTKGRAQNTKKTVKYFNWRKFRNEIKINLEDHLPYFKTYCPSNDDEIEEQIARETYREYMMTSGIYGTSAELMGAVQHFGITATIIAQDFRATQSYMIYHLDGLKRGTRSRKQRIYIHFSGHPSKGHFQLLEPLTPMKPENPSPLSSGQFRVREQNNLHLTISKDTSQFRGDDDDWETFLKGLYTVKPENLKRTGSNFEQPAQPKQKVSRGAIIPVKKSETTTNVIHQREESIKERSSIEKLLVNEMMNVQSKDLMEMDDKLLKSIDNILMSSEEFESIMGQYCGTLMDLQKDILSGTGGVGTDWTGIKVSKVWSQTNFYTNFILFQPHAKKPLSRTNFRTHFVVYNQDSIYLTVEMDEDTKRQALLLHNVFSLDEGQNYMLENKLDHPVLMRVWWIHC